MISVEYHFSLTIPTILGLIPSLAKMIYYFPNESPSELLEKEKTYEIKAIERARQVEKHGYRKREPTIPSSYIEWRCLNDYLKCPIKPWKWPVSSSCKVELEPLPTEFLSTRLLSKPLLFFDPVEKKKIRRICGFREILQKREYVEYLRDVENEDIRFVSDNFDDPTTRSCEPLHFTSLVLDNDGYKLENNDSWQQRDENENVANYYRYHYQKAINLGRGGGANPPPPKVSPKKAEQQTRENLEEVFKYQKLFRVPAGHERDTEWMELSFSDPDEDDEDPINKPVKEHLPWMLSGISFESQFLERTVNPYKLSLALTGRGFLGTKPDFDKGHMDYNHHRGFSTLIFFITSTVLWVCFCLIVVSFVNISFENQEGKNKNRRFQEQEEGFGLSLEIFDVYERGFRGQL